VTVVNEDLEQHLHGLFGHQAFRPGQREVIESVLAGRNTLAVLPTGGGKSLTYQFPSSISTGVTLVLSPLIALMKDQIRSAPADLNAVTTIINSSLDAGEVWRRLRDVSNGKYRLIYAAPERLRQPAFLHALRRAPVSLLVVDEAHCISQWGHDFRPDYRAVGRAVEFLAPRCVLAVTATATPSVQDDIERQLGRRMTRIVRPTFRDNLRLSCREVSGEEEKRQCLRDLCHEEEGPILVYARSRQKCEDIAELLQQDGLKAGFYHARLDPDERTAAQDRFMDGSIRVMAATVAFGMGVDKSDIRALIHYKPSSSLENYYQEAGRAGRDGAPSRCVLLHSKADMASALRYLREETIDIDDAERVYKTIRGAVGRIGPLPADDLSSYLGRESDRLRTAIPLLEQVGLLRRHTDLAETLTVSLRRDIGTDADTSLRRLTEMLDEPMPPLALAGHVGVAPMDLELMLMALQDEGVISFRASGRSPMFEILPPPPGAKARLEALLRDRAALAKSRTSAMLNYTGDTCRHAAIARYFGDRWYAANCESCDICVPEKYEVPLRPTKASVRASSATSHSKRDSSKRAPAAVRTAEGLTESQQGLLARLKAWRTEQARERRVPPYVIFSDNMLNHIAAAEPRNTAQMLAIAGIGPKKAADYGDDVLRIVAEG